MTIWQKIIQQARQILHSGAPEHADDVAALTSSLAREIQAQFPQLTQRQAERWAGITGLLCRVAFIDVNISEAEKKQLMLSLQQYLGDENAYIVHALAEIGMTHMKTWAGIEGHLYCDHLKNELSLEEKRRLLDSLFILAGSDGNADSQETDEIKTIARGLLLEDKEYYLARSRHKDLLGALRQD